MKKIIIFISLIAGVLLALFTLDLTNMDGIKEMKDKLCK